MRFAEKFSSKRFQSLARCPGQDGIALAGTALDRPTMAWLLRLDQDGLQRWQHEDEDAVIEDPRTGALEGSLYNGLAVHPDGSVSAVGTHGIHGEAVPRGLVRRFTPDGAVVWERLLGTGTAGSELSACAALADGGLVVVGQDWQRKVSNCVLRLDAAGKAVWDIRIGDGAAWHRSVAACAGGDLLIAGFAASASGKQQASVTRLTPAGQAVFGWLWSDEPGETRFLAATTLPEGGAVLGGSAAMDGAPRSSEAFVMSIDPQGKPIWRLRLPVWPPVQEGERQQTEVTGLAITADGIFLSGWRIGPGQGQQCAWAAKVGLDGIPIWQECYGGDLKGSFNSVVALDDGSALFAGWVQATGGQSQAWLARIDADGKLRDEPVN